MKWVLALLLFIQTPFWPMDAEILPGDALIIVNKQTNELALVEEGKIQFITKVATGKTDELTPEGLFTVKVKAINPYYRKKNIQGGDPNNPLGTRWIGFDAEGTDGRTYGVHGTNNAGSIGLYVSQGCIRMPREELEQLYERVHIGTKILIVHSSQTFEQIASEYLETT